MMSMIRACLLLLLTAIWPATAATAFQLNDLAVYTIVGVCFSDSVFCLVGGAPVAAKEFDFFALIFACKSFPVSTCPAHMAIGQEHPARIT